MSDWFSKIKDLRARLGTAALAKKLRIPAPSLRRLLSTGKWSPAMRKRAEKIISRYEAAQKRKTKSSSQPVTSLPPESTDKSQDDVEREAIQTEPPAIVPGYSESKKKWVLLELRRLRGEIASEWSDTKRAIKLLEKQKTTVPTITKNNLERFRVLSEKLKRAEERMTPKKEMTLDQVLDRIAVDSIDYQAPRLARKFKMSVRGIYTLFFSPPTHGIGIKPP